MIATDRYATTVPVTRITLIPGCAVSSSASDSPMSASFSFSPGRTPVKLPVDLGHPVFVLVPHNPWAPTHGLDERTHGFSETPD